MNNEVISKLSYLFMIKQYTDSATLPLHARILAIQSGYFLLVVERH